MIPAVLYGHKVDNVSLTIQRDSFESVLRHHGRILNLRFPDGGAENAVIKQVQWDPLGEEILHIDLLRVALDELIMVMVEVELVGVPKGQAEGGTLDQPVREVEIECTPMAIPDKIELNVSHMSIGDFLRVKDLPLPPGIRSTENPELTVAILHAPAEEAEELAVEEEVPAEPELISKTQKEEEEK
jgi:large subunit ribosomal protein L25